jgi:hypothetical protein
MNGRDPLAGRFAQFVRFAERRPLVSFAVAQLGVWGLFYLIQYLALLPNLAVDERVPFLVLELTMFVTGPTVTTMLYLWYGRLKTLPVPGGSTSKLLLVLGGVWIGSRLWIVIDGWLISAIVSMTSVRFDWDRVSRIMGGSYWLTLLAWTGGYYAFRFWREAQVRERAVLEMRLRARDAQLRALAYQLNPHFLFNTLNAVRALVLEDPERAREMITRLATFLRYSLQVPDHAENTVAAEMEALRSYLAIEKVRFEERLSVEWDIDPDALERIVPSLVLQPLVENAIRHGGREQDGHQEVRIGARLEHDVLRLSVENTGELRPDRVNGSGVGLDNVRARLEHAFPGRHALSIEETGGWVRVAIVIRPEPLVASE